jgi:N-acetylmuramoyl-L-alanine amidase
VKIDAGRTSPNHSARPTGVKPRLIVLHADASPSHLSSINHILNPASDVSYHYIIARDGGITQLVPDAKRAWHAGISQFFGVPDCNDYSIGVSFSNKNDGVEQYDSRALAMGIELVASLMKAHGIGLDCITTHEAIARPMGRKTDPGPLFPLGWFLTAVRMKAQG